MKNSLGKTALTDRYQLSTSLRIQGADGLDFDEISHILKVPPSKTIKKGTLSGTGRIYEVNTWIFDSEIPESETLESHLRWLGRNLADAETIRTVRNLHAVEEIDVFCAISTSSTACRIVLPVDLLVALRSMTLDLELSLVFGSTPVGAVYDDAQIEVEQPSARDELVERASATLQGTLMPSVKLVMLDALRLSLDGNLAATLASPKLERGIGLMLRTRMEEGSLDSKLLELSEILDGSVQQLLTLGEANSFGIEVRFEATCEWASTRLSYKSFGIPISLGCPITIEVVLV